MFTPISPLPVYEMSKGDCRMLNTICLALDGLHRNFVGAYGNTWIHTPAWDQLAFESATFDQFLVEDVNPPVVIRACWTGHHPLQDSTGSPSLAEILNNAGVHTLLVTDSWDLLPVELGVHFRSRVLVEAPWPKLPAEETGESYLANVFGRCVAALEAMQEPFCAWIILRGVSSPWDAPVDLRAHYADEGDPPPYEGVIPPNMPFRKTDDPDILLAILQAYAAQVTVLDNCLEAFRAWFMQWPLSSSTALVIFSLRGFPLGEHGWIGWEAPPLYSESVHVPLIFRLPERVPTALRTPALAQPSDLFPTILAASGLLHAVPKKAVGRNLMPILTEEKDGVRNRLVPTHINGPYALRTTHWYYRDADLPELFIKPDDFWDFNSVADRCSDVAHAMKQALDEAIRTLKEGSWEDFPPLDELIQCRPE